MEVYKALSPIQTELWEIKVIDLYGKITEAMYEYVREALLRFTLAGAPDIEIWFTCEGGNFDVGLRLYDLIIAYDGKTTGVVKGYCCSTAPMILQACDERQITEYSRILIHNPKYTALSSEEAETEEKAKEFFANNLRLMAIMPDILIRTTGRTREEIKIQLKKNEDLTAKESLDFGLVDVIIYPQPKRKPTNEQ